MDILFKIVLLEIYISRIIFLIIYVYITTSNRRVNSEIGDKTIAK